MQYQSEEVNLVFAKYVTGNLAAQLICEDGTPYTTISKNLVDTQLSDVNCVFVDTNNNTDKIINWLERNELGELTGRVGFSGFCSYPEFRFKQELITV